MTAVDTLIFTSRLPLANEDLCHVADLKVSLGGKGMVTALALFSLGCKVSVFTLVGEQAIYQDEVRKLLPRGFDTSNICPWLKRNNRTWIAISSSQEVYTFVDLGPVNEVPHNLVKSRVEDFVGNVDVLYISTECPSVLYKAIEIVKNLGCTVVSNLNAALITDPSDSGNSLLKSLIAVSHTIIMNEAESLEVLSRLGIADWSHISSGLLREVLVTHADKGGILSCYPFTEWETYDSWSAAQVRCAVGAGDTFNGAYVKARFIDGASLKKSCEYAAKIAAQKVEIASSALLAQG